jgi:hypothetical protein
MSIKVQQMLEVAAGVRENRNARQKTNLHDAKGRTLIVPESFQTHEELTHTGIRKMRYA